MMERAVLEFERPIFDLEKKIEELKRLDQAPIELSEQIQQLELQAAELREQTFAQLTPWQVVQLSRHPSRPYTLDYIDKLIVDFCELHGDRAWGDDHAIVGGLGFFDRSPIMVIGHQKGRNTKENMYRNFGMPRPEGYRKAKRLMEMASRYEIPILTFIDTPGAYPGLDAEERGQAEAIAKNLEVMSGLTVPIIAVVIGEGGSGGALALGVADRVFMLQYAVYSVISPEGCASILWKDNTRASDAAQVLKLQATDIVNLKVADDVIAEPLGGAHRDIDAAAKFISDTLVPQLRHLKSLSQEQLLNQRYEKFRRMGVFLER